MRSQLFVASTAFGLATLAAALDAGLFGAADRRVLLLSTNAAIPEISPGPTAATGTERLLDRFDHVADYNAVVAPQHPARWRPRAEDLPLWQRALAREWGLDPSDLRLVVESIQTPPSLGLAAIFAEARIDVYGDGLMSYGPTRVALPSAVGARIERLLHLNLVPGLRPVLLREFDVPAVLIPVSSFRHVVAGLGAASVPAPDPRAGATAVLLGQYLAAGALLTAEEELSVHLAMVRGAARAGFASLVFKPHPSTVGAASDPLVEEAARCGARLHVATAPELVESWYATGSVGLVVGCFSTGLVTGASLYGVPAACVGTDLVLRRLRPYENSNRIPAVIVDATVPALAELPASPGRSGPSGPSTAGPDAEAGGTPLTGGALQAVVEAVAYCMQPTRNPGLRGTAESVLRGGWRRHRAYWNRRVLTGLDLPGRIPRRRHPAKAVVRRVVGARVYARLGRAWSVLSPAR